MEALVLRIGLTPFVFVAVSCAQARFGQWIGGRLVGLPLTTGPFLLAVCLLSGRAAAAHAAAGVVTGQLAVVVFCTAYAHCAARRVAPARATVRSLFLAVVAVAALTPLRDVWLAATASWIAIGVSLARWPSGDDAAPPGGRPGAVLPRATVSTALVASMSALVPVLGAWLAGVLTSAPVLLAMLLPAAHRDGGAAGAAALARGTVVSMAGTVAFGAVLATGLPKLTTAAAFGLAAAVLVLFALAAAPMARLLA